MMKYLLNNTTTVFLVLLLAGQWVSAGNKQDSSVHLQVSNSAIHFNLSGYGDIIKLPETWKFHAGDSLAWADSSFNDSSWDSLKPELEMSSLEPAHFSDIGWFRVRFKADTAILHKPLALMLTQKGASEVYIDGKLIQRFGRPDKDPLKEIRYNPNLAPVGFELDKTGTHVFAVRYSNHRAFSNYKRYNVNSQGFVLMVSNMNDALKTYHKSTVWLSAILMFLAGSLLSFGIFHLILFLFYHNDRSNVHYSIFSISFGLVLMAGFAHFNLGNPDLLNYASFFIAFMLPFTFVALEGLLYSFFRPYMPKIYWIMLAGAVLSLGLAFYSYSKADSLSTLVSFIALVDTLRIASASGWRKIKETKYAGKIEQFTLIAFGVFCLLAVLSFFVSSLGFAKSIPLAMLIIAAIIFVVAVLGSILFIPVIMLVRHARGFSATNKNLELQLEQVQVLSAKSIAQEQEKQRILESQKEELEKQVKVRTAEVVEQKEEIESQRDELEHQKVQLEEKNKEVTDSITYAKRLQQAILPPAAYIKQYFPESFVLYKPKDIVAGDFYWMQTLAPAEGNKKGMVLIAAADCTGHGVPGAMVSIVCANALNRAVKEFGLTIPGEILDKTAELVVETFARSESEVKDGMDISLLAIDLENNNLYWAGANNPLYYILNGELQSIIATKQPVGLHYKHEHFITHTVTIPSGATLYLFTDGYADQFGGPEGKKLMSKRFKEKLLEINSLHMEAQKAALDLTFETWKGKQEQVDDVLVMGIKL